MKDEKKWGNSWRGVLGFSLAAVRKWDHIFICHLRVGAKPYLKVRPLLDFVLEYKLPIY
jgi:hypothetical protein